MNVGVGANGYQILVVSCDACGHCGHVDQPFASETPDAQRRPYRVRLLQRNGLNGTRAAYI
jgi:hypothetical protein